jgi:hypothetical protein
MVRMGGALIRMCASIIIGYSGLLAWDSMQDIIPCHIPTLQQLVDSKYNLQEELLVVLPFMAQPSSVKPMLHSYVTHSAVLDN